MMNVRIKFNANAQRGMEEIEQGNVTFADYIFTKKGAPKTSSYNINGSTLSPEQYNAPLESFYEAGWVKPGELIVVNESIKTNGAR